MDSSSIAFPEAGLIGFILVTVGLLILLGLRPSLTAARGGKILAFIVFFIMPVVALWAGTSAHLTQAKSTDFCLSCHVMEPYGESLWLDDDDHLPAGHFQHNRINRDDACFTCHTTYTMFGDVKAKLNGLQHLFVNYLGTIPDKIELYSPYQNRECLHCHSGSRSFEELHGDFKADLVSNETSCLDCHEFVHDVDQLAKLDRWSEAPEWATTAQDATEASPEAAEEPTDEGSEMQEADAGDTEEENK